MKRETIFLKFAVVIVGIPIMGLCAILVPLVLKDAYEYFSWLCLPVFLAVYLAAIPFYFALWKTFKLLCYINKNQFLSNLFVQDLKYIKYCMFTIASIFAVSLPFFCIMAVKHDAPGLVILGMLLIFVSTVLGVFASVLQKIFRNIIEMKKEIV